MSKLLMEKVYQLVETALTTESSGVYRRIKFTELIQKETNLFLNSSSRVVINDPLDPWHSVIKVDFSTVEMAKQNKLEYQRWCTHRLLKTGMYLNPCWDFIEYQEFSVLYADKIVPYGQGSASIEDDAIYQIDEGIEYLELNMLSDKIGRYNEVDDASHWGYNDNMKNYVCYDYA